MLRRLKSLFKMSENTIFTYIDSLIFTKKKIEEVPDEENQFTMYMANRWISMHSCICAQIINESTNRYWSNLQVKKDQYNFMYNLLPKMKRTRLNYIKKVKEKLDENSDVELIAKKYELSKKEVVSYLEFLA